MRLFRYHRCAPEEYEERRRRSGRRTRAARRPRVVGRCCTRAAVGVWVEWQHGELTRKVSVALATGARRLRPHWRGHVMRVRGKQLSTPLWAVANDAARWHPRRRQAILHEPFFFFGKAHERFQLPCVHARSTRKIKVFLTLATWRFMVPVEIKLCNFFCD